MRQSHCLEDDLHSLTELAGEETRNQGGSELQRKRQNPCAHQWVDPGSCVLTRETAPFGQSFDLDTRVNSLSFVKYNTAFSTVRSNQMLNIKCHVKEKQPGNKCALWLWISKPIIWYEKYFYLYWAFGLSSEFISEENSCCIQCFSLYSAKQCSSVWTFKYLFWFHWDKCLALARIWFAFYLYEEPIRIRPTRDI